MSTVTTRDSVEIYYKDWGPKDAQPIALVMHGDDDQIVPIAASARRSIELLKNGTLMIYKRFPHGMCTTHADVVNPTCSPSSRVEHAVRRG